MNVLKKIVNLFVWGRNWIWILLLLYASLECNGRNVEWKIRHLLEVYRASFLGMNVLRKYWSKSVPTNTYIINRLLSGMSPLETLIHKPNSFLVPPKMFGCTCFVHFLGPQCDKLDSKAVKCFFFLGLPSSQKIYKCYDLVTKKKNCLNGCHIFLRIFCIFMGKNGGEQRRSWVTKNSSFVAVMPSHSESSANIFSQIVKHVKNLLWLRHFAQKESKCWSWKWSSDNW